MARFWDHLAFVNMIQLCPSDRKLLDQIFQNAFDQSRSFDEANRVLNLAQRIQLSKKKLDELYNDLRTIEHVI